MPSYATVQTLVNPRERIKCLTAIDIFADLTESEILELSKRAPVRAFDAAQILYTPDQNSEILFMLSEGRVKLYHIAPEGNQLMTGYLETGAIFGEMSALGQSMYNNYAETMSACAICIMRRSDVEDILLSNLKITNRLLKTLGQRLLDAEMQLYMLSLKNVAQRVALILAFVANRTNSPRVNYTHEQLAQVVNSTRATVTKVLNDFQDRGFVTLERGTVVVNDVRRVQAISEAAD